MLVTGLSGWITQLRLMVTVSAESSRVLLTSFETFCAIRCHLEIWKQKKDFRHRLCSASKNRFMCGHLGADCRNRSLRSFCQRSGTEGLSILDIGCGSGRLVELFEEAGLYKFRTWAHPAVPRTSEQSTEMAQPRPNTDTHRSCPDRSMVLLMARMATI